MDSGPSLTAVPSSEPSLSNKRVIHWGERLLYSWFKVQLSHHGGKYSLERLLALEEYTRTVSLTRVALVCVGTPLPMMVLVILQELIPLQDPASGSRANYGFWIRVGLLTGVAAHTAAGQAQFLVSRVHFTPTQLALIFCCVATTFPVIMMGAASVLVFPIPFIVISAVPIFYLVMVASFRAVSGPNIFKDMMANTSELWKYVAFIIFQALMMIVYPGYQTIFTAAIGTYYEVPVILLLPVIKMTMKYLFSITTSHVEDLMPEAVIFTAEFFNSLYLATFMQRTSAPATFITMVVIDFCQISVGLYQFHVRTNTIVSRIENIVGVRDQRNVLLSTCLLCRKPGIYQSQIRNGVRVHSHFQHQLQDSSRKLLDSLAGVVTDKAMKYSHSKRFYRKVRFKHQQFSGILTAPRITRSARIQPSIPNTDKASPHTNNIVPVTKSPAQHSLILQETLEALFTSECLVLTEYLESLVPGFYGCFVLVLVCLPNVKYHNDLEGITVENVHTTVEGVFALGVLEIISFIVVAVVLQRNCGVKALYQLAFVLETQRMLIQDKIALWMLMTMAFRVVHFGVDFTFQFAWI
ncbi:hypothetical protein V7S43_007101 [Phytophthora oleae]|uniref:Uncharacterized protein n=1 Tax=Phytophthora oleae TaxID=2107226 RepID=A0ABD3FKW8_9STRA